MIILAVLFVVGINAAAPAHAAEPCVKVVVLTTGLTVCVPVSQLPTITVTIPRATVTLPRVTTTVTLPRVTSTVTLPRQTVTLPRVTTTRNITLPVQTVTQNRVVNLPAVTRTDTIVRNQTGGNTTITGPAVTNTLRVSGGSGQTTVTRDRILPTTVPSTVTVTKNTQTKGEVITITKNKAVGISLLLVLLGILLALVLVWLAFTYGWITGDGGNRRFIKEVTEELRYK